MIKSEGGLLLVTFDVDSDVEDELDRWYEEEHIAERLAIEGFTRARRYQATEGGPKHLALYDLTSVDVLNSDAYIHARTTGATPWTLRMESKFRNFERSKYRLISDRKA